MRKACLVAMLFTAALAFGQTDPDAKLPTGVILVPGALPSASDSKTPLPEGGYVASGRYTNRYFDLVVPLPDELSEKFKGPPPSDSGAYVLADLAREKGGRGTMLITAQDLFFSLLPARTAAETIRAMHDRVQRGYDVEAPSELRIDNRTYWRLDYTSPVAGLHWTVLATEARCHTIEFLFISRETSVIDAMVAQMKAVQLPDADPIACVADYASRAENIVARVDPVLTERRFNAIPTRFIVDVKGKVTHVHVISAFPEQAKIITDALMQWRFKPYVQNGEAVAVETGLMFGALPKRGNAAAETATQ